MKLIVILSAVAVLSTSCATSPGGAWDLTLKKDSEGYSLTASGKNPVPTK